MSMSKKDFIALADTVRGFERLSRENDFDALQIIPAYRNLLADFCAYQNPAFNRSRWLDYIAGECGPNGGTIKEGAK